MSDAVADPLEDVIRKAGEGWMIDWYAPKEGALPRFREVLRRANEWGQHRFGANAPQLTPESLVANYRGNPHKIRAFLQVIGSTESPQILVMVWRILQGMNIDAIRMEYEEAQPFHLYVRLASPYGETEDYESNDIDDAVILRHLGTIKMGDHGVFTGIHALNLTKN
jgi:hypothetical protein